MRDYSGAAQSEEEMDVRKGPWTIEEDSLLVNHITIHGEGRWNSLASCAGLKRTGKSCRLRWLNYLRPDVRHGNITLQEQLLILELHSRWGNRWSKIAQHLPGRTDNEIKNYWRTRVQKQAKQLKCDVNSKQFRDAMRFVWMPRLVERIQAASESPAGQPATATTTFTNQTDITTSQVHLVNEFGSEQVDPNTMPEISGASSDMSGSQVSPVSDLTDCYNQPGDNCLDSMPNGLGLSQEGLDFHAFEQSNDWLGGGDSLESLWNDENFWFLQEQFHDEGL